MTRSPRRSRRWKKISFFDSMALTIKSGHPPKVALIMQPNCNPSSGAVPTLCMWRTSARLERGKLLPRRTIPTCGFISRSQWMALPPRSPNGSKPWATSRWPRRIYEWLWRKSCAENYAPRAEWAINHHPSKLKNLVSPLASKLNCSKIAARFKWAAK